jgi:tRNA pseudouridine55 synthase
LLNAALVQPGLYLAYKPTGITSFERLAAFRAVNATGKQWPICHSGVLDPFAHGLLIFLVGPATRLMERLHAAPKHYIAEVAWGRETDSLDAAGLTVREGDATHLTEAELETALLGRIGWHEQVPPKMSNKRIDGERAYVKARRGDDFELPPSKVYLHQARWFSHHLPERSTLELVCSSGFYVRALARDLGHDVTAYAHLRALERTRIGPWSVDDAKNGEVHIHGSAVLPWLGSRRLTDAEVGEFRKEQPIVRGVLAPAEWPLPKQFPNSEEVKLLHQGRLIGLAKQVGETLVPVLDLHRGL